MLKQFSVFFFCALFTFPAQVLAETAPKIPVAPESLIGTDSMAKMITGLLLVLGIIIISTWALKRFSIIPAISSSSHLKIVAATGVGQRERVVIVEIGETWLVLGVAPGQVTQLHTMERPLPETANKTLQRTSSEFSHELDKRIEKGKTD
ncbi:MAG: flagellar biosynthetic protein FliO [Nitrosomonas sp.]|nr:flagellar biosynthetic protein FliO [Nitrosomonas sp.]